MIERVQGTALGRNKSTAYKDLVWTVATASDESLDLINQTKEALNTLEHSLTELGSDKTNILSAQVFLSDISNKQRMDEVWNAWIGNDPENWPQRACLGVQLEGNYLIEIVVTALRVV
ncbi:MAG: RidA family protein [Chloroflexota bacterium]